MRTEERIMWIAPILVVMLFMSGFHYGKRRPDIVVTESFGRTVAAGWDAEHKRRAVWISHGGSFERIWMDQDSTNMTFLPVGHEPVEFRQRLPIWPSVEDWEGMFTGHTYFEQTNSQADAVEILEPTNSLVNAAKIPLTNNEDELQLEVYNPTADITYQLPDLDIRKVLYVARVEVLTNVMVEAKPDPATGAVPGAFFFGNRTNYVIGLDGREIFKVEGGMR